MRFNAEERDALRVAALATVTTVTSLARAVQKKRLFPALLAVGSACCAVGALSYLDGACRVAEAEEAEACATELLDATECEEALCHLGIDDELDE